MVNAKYIMNVKVYLNELADQCKKKKKRSDWPVLVAKVGAVVSKYWKVLVYICDIDLFNAIQNL